MGKSSRQQAEPLDTSVSRAGNSNSGVWTDATPEQVHAPCMFQAKQNTSHDNKHAAGLGGGVLSATQEIADTSMPHACLYLHCLFAKLIIHVNV